MREPKRKRKKKINFTKFLLLDKAVIYKLVRIVLEVKKRGRSHGLTLFQIFTHMSLFFFFETLTHMSLQSAIKGIEFSLRTVLSPLQYFSTYSGMRIQEQQQRTDQDLSSILKERSHQKLDQQITAHTHPHFKQPGVLNLNKKEDGMSPVRSNFAKKQKHNRELTNIY